MMLKVINVFKMIKEGRGIKDKLSIFMFYLVKPFGAKKLPFNTILKNKFGVFVCDKNPERICHSLEDYEKSLQKYLDIKKGSFVDVGAHVGRLSIQIAKKSEEVSVFSIEAESSNFKTLLRNIKNNNIKNITPINLACSDKNGYIDFFVLGKASGGNSLIDNHVGGRKVSVQAKKLDDIVKEYSVSNLKLLKIDVEGAEIKVLNGGRKTINKFKPKILFESWSIESLKEIKSFLEPLGYKIKNIDKYNNYFAEPYAKLKN